LFAVSCVPVIFREQLHLVLRRLSAFNFEWLLSRLLISHK
jgi:hypothetical protein